MAGISKKLFFASAALLAMISCIKEELPEQPDFSEEEIFAQYDPVVHFGLGTFMDPYDPVTRTTYAGDDQTYVIGSKRYERINWNVGGASGQDYVLIAAETGSAVTKDGAKQTMSYKAVRIPTTNNTGTKDDEADSAPSSGNAGDYFYWTASDAPRYFYAVYPTPDNALVAGTTLTDFSVDKNTHTASFRGEIRKNQNYIAVKDSPGATGNVREYMPDMTNAYMYAAAVIPAKDVGYKKVPLRFKPLYSAVKLIISAGDAGSKNYRLKNVQLRTDLHYEDTHLEENGALNPAGIGTALGGKFKAVFSAQTTTGVASTTGDFTRPKPAPFGTDPDTEVTDTLKCLSIDIKDSDRMPLGDDTLKVTFLLLPIDQQVMTVDYTFEYRVDDTKPWTEPGNVKEVHRLLSLQKPGGNSEGFPPDNIFRDTDLKTWYKLAPAVKLYIRSGVPEIEYRFRVQAQGNFPRTWNSGDDIKDGTHYYSDDFYSVQSYRDSAGVKQSMKWKVTGYKNPGDAKFEMSNRPAWLRLRGDAGTWDETQELTDPVNHGWDAGGDPWEAPWGAGTPMESGDFSKTEDFVSHARNYIKGSSFVSYVSAAQANEGGYLRNESLDSDGKPDVFENNRDWDVPVSYLCKDLDGKYYYQEDHNHKPSAGWKGLKGEAYAYDLSSHDIYGRLIVPKNGDLGTTANCYVVSAPGWYRFPAVYGCSVKNGGDNKKAYTGAGGADLMGAFLNHNANGITSPGIPGIDAVDVLWDDANHMVASSTTVGSRADRKPFYHKEPSDAYGYIYFYVDDIAQGNALLVAKSGGTIVWSWHIWAVTKPGTFLRTVGMETSKKDFAGNDNPYQSVYGTNYFWQKTDIGQHGSESGEVAPRYCDVEFTQYFRGKVVKKVVARFLQSGVKDGREEPIFFQWGRKDPFPKDKMGVGGTTTPIALTTENTHETIKKPDFFYGGGAEYVPTGKRYDNLWNTNIDKAPSEHYSDGSDEGSLDRKVEKTIYDPSPPGFHVANMYCLSALNPKSPIDETKIPSTDANQLAKDARPSAKYYHGIRYYDFYAEYDETVAYRRKVTGETIRFYILGRLAASSFNTDKPNEALYWYSEPAVWSSGGGKIFYGRSLWLGSNHPTGSDEWQLYPVAGRDNSQKWQRNHALPVRPMAEGTQPDKQFGGTNMNPPSNQNPF